MIETSTDKALTIWNQMNPFERLAVMDSVEKHKSMPVYFRRCIAHIAANLNDYN